MKNKYQEALDNLVHCKSITRCKECKHKNLCTMERDSKILQELVEKETPKKLTTKKSDFLSSRTGEKLGEYILPFRYCPKCDKCVNPNYCDIPNYCHNCGQKLDWSE